MFRLRPCLFALAFLLPLTISAQQGTFDPHPVFDGGGMRLHLSMRGQIAHNEVSIINGLLWPGDGASHGRLRGMCHSSTPVMLGTVNGERRVSASYYRDNFIPGPIIGGKPAVDPTDPFFRAYTVTWQETETEDYREWPVNLGAPVQENGEPFFYGRKQMFWVMNDLDAASMMENNGSLPLGLEMRCLLYEPWPAQARENTLLLQVTYINKGNEHITDAYAGYFMDADVRDDFMNLAGSDSLRNMVYTRDYNTLRDETGMPAALGLLMLQTPVVEAEGERARWFAGWKEDAVNIPVSAAVLPIKWRPTAISEPQLGDYIAQWDALVQGQGAHGVHVINPHTGVPSRFWLSGDPVRGTGWLPEHGLPLSNGENVNQGPADTRVLISAGPFSLAPGDTQQVTYAFIATQGATPEAALHELQDRAEYMQAWFAERPPATAYRSAVVRPANSNTAPGQIDVTARFGDVPVDCSVEVSDATGNVLITASLDRFSVESEWVYRTTVTLPQPHRQGVNISFISEWNGEEVRIPGRVSFPVGGSVDFDGIVMLEEGDDNGRVAPDENAKW
ncbi:MAG: hypothetical protein KFH87_11530, partial [Bacteroidetes bacterium]|nr:hypothetical protein [Bacteroidota bacterium]